MNKQFDPLGDLGIIFKKLEMMDFCFSKVEERLKRIEETASIKSCLKTKHSCCISNITNAWFCDESDSGAFELVGPNRVKDRVFVKFCPFCGAKANV